MRNLWVRLRGTETPTPPVMSLNVSDETRVITPEFAAGWQAAREHADAERQPDYSVFYEWVAENAPRIVELCPYKFPRRSEQKEETCDCIPDKFSSRSCPKCGRKAVA